MNIQELQSFNLADAAKFHFKLNQKLWGPDEHLLPEVKEKLLAIAEDFRAFLGVPELDVKDITISGSNAAYSYTDKSDIDLHLVVDFPENKKTSDVYRELFNAKKYQYNNLYDYKIGDAEVELYVQDASEPHYSQGIYSLLGNKWNVVPRRVKADIDDISVKHKYEDWGHKIEQALESDDEQELEQTLKRLKDIRAAGLANNGEFGVENLTFKLLRNEGLIQKLFDKYHEVKSKRLSLEQEQNRKHKRPFVYGYSEDVSSTPDGVDQSTCQFLNERPVEEDATSTPSGVSASTNMFLDDVQGTKPEDLLKEFVKYCHERLGLTGNMKIKLRRDPQWSVRNATFGRYNPNMQALEVAWGNRHIMDIFRTVAHELVHQKQNQDKVQPEDAGDTGSEWENEANAIAGVLMREWGQQHPELFDVTMIQAQDELDENKLSKAAAALAMSTALGMTPAKAQSLGDALRTIQNIGTAAKTASTMTRAGINAELAQELANYIRAQGGDPHGQNQSTLYQWQKRMEQDRKAREADSQPASDRYLDDFKTDNNRPARYYQDAETVKEGASGYIPTKKQAKDPRYSMALTVDIKPGQIGKEANKLKLKTNSQGKPQIARADGLFENLLQEYKSFKAREDYSPDEPPGPEFKPTMPAGTLRVDVSDVYDWYKLGQHISDLKGLGQHDFGQGPPSSVISFGDEDTEHKFIQNLKRTGLDVTDIDPIDSIKRAGEKIKTDPTYNVNEDEDLDEVKMSPGALEKFAASDAAKGIRAGFEAELIFRDTQGEADELDPEPNYDADERAYSIQQVIDFFANDEYGYGISQRQMDRLEEELDERYMEWRDEQIMSDFRNDAEDLIRDILLEETPMDQRIHFYLTDSLQMSDEEADAVIKAGAEAPRFTNSDAQKDYADENPEYKAYLEAADEAEQELEESVEFSLNRQDEYWDEALDKYRDDYSGDDDSFFSDVGLRWMSDIANEFDLGWPVWDGGEQQNYGSRSWEDIGNSLQDVVDMPVVVSSGYHSTRRREGQWIIEPDGSLDPDDKSEEAGLEIVSPPMPLLTAIEKLKQVTDWANDPNGGNAYTNSSTGLHMGVSLPTMTAEAAPNDPGIDYVKLILFLGDKYVLQQFGREANTYTASALEKLRQNIKGNKSDPAGVIKLLQHGLTELAHKELQKGVGTSKYTSAHIRPGYIEFRSPGGDWLAKADEEIGVLENTMMRFARALQIAGDPNAERKEYAKKLYKLVTQDNEQYADQLRLFSEFSAGTINKEQLKKQWADSVLQKELPSVGKAEYEVYRRDKENSPDATVGTLYARDYDDAYDQFLRQYGRDINDLDVRIKQPWFDVFDDKGRIVKTLRAKDIDKATERAQYEFGQQWTDAWKIYRRPDDTPEPKDIPSPRAQVAKRIATKPKGGQQYQIVDRKNAKVVGTFGAQNDSEANKKFSEWLRIKGLPTDTEDYGYRPDDQAADARRDSADLQRNLGVRDVEPNVAQNFDPSAYERNSERIAAIQAQAQQPGNWEIYQSDDPSRVVNTFIDVTERQVQDWLRRQETQGMPPGFLSARRQTANESVGSIRGNTGKINRKKLDTILAGLCSMVIEGQRKDNDFYGMVAAAVIDPDGRMVTGINYLYGVYRVHAERAAIDKYEQQYGELPPGSTVVTTLSPCSGHSGDVRQGASCTELLNEKRVKMAYCGYKDHTQENQLNKFTQFLTKNEKLKNLCEGFAETFLKENFADGKKPGRKGLAKRMGVPTKASVSKLRQIAKSSSGEKARMAHWMANMKAGKKKK